MTAPKLRIRPGDEALREELRELQALITRHPRVTRAIVAAFAAEGRAYARTAEGRRLRQALARSPAVQRLRTLWDAFGLERYARAASSVTPGRWVGVLAAAAQSAALEEILSRLLLDRGVGSR